MRVLRPSRIFILVAAATWLLPSLNARGHVVKFPRLVQVVLGPESVTMGLALTQHAGPRSELLRGRFDASGDGRLDEQERSSLAAWLDDRARRSLRLSLENEELRTEVVQRSLDLVGSDRAIEGDALRLSSVAVLSLGLRSGTHRFRLEDRPENLRELVPIRLDLPPGWILSDVLAEGEALPLESSGPYSWQASFAGQGGSLQFTVTVPESQEDRSSSKSRGAANPPPEVGSLSTGSEP